MANRITWYHTKLDRALLKELTTRSNVRPLVHILGQFALAAATGVGAYLVHLYLPWPFLIPALFAHGTVYTFFGASGSGHELSHRTVFKSKWMNELFIAITGFMSFFPYTHFRKSHAKHHQLTVHEDEDLEVILPVTYKPIAWLWVLTINVPGMIRILGLHARHAAGIFRSEWEQRILPPSDTTGRAKVSWWARITLIGHAALAATFILTGNWILLFLVTLAPFTANWLNFLCGLPQHLGLLPSVPDFRVCCRTMEIGWLPRFLYWNMNYHVEHHMYAGVPFYNLAKLRRAIEHDVAPATKGLFRTWREEIIPLARAQRENPNHVAVPRFPDTAVPPPIPEDASERFVDINGVLVSRAGTAGPSVAG